MGIHGIFKEIGQGQRISLAKLSADHFVVNDRPLRLAIDISIWLFQIQAGKGGSNPALRTFYYRLLRLLSLNIHPLFVFDGPNKPLFKRNKKVGGPGVRVASVPEFLAKQLLNQFGFPWHVAPGEAEAECALLQRECIVDAVLSEDVDTLMFGSGVTLRNWSAENTSKTPTHVNVYRAEQTKENSGLDREGMILVALMSGGDYITEGIPGCGPKLACDAARAGYGHDLCAIRKKDSAGFKAWRERLQHQIHTNEDKIFSRKNTKVSIPNDFPNLEVLGYYTQPCVSTPDKLAKLRQSLKWDQTIDFPALRSFAADAFDWRCLGGAKKFIRNLAPAMLVRELRMCADQTPRAGQEVLEEREKQYICAIHGKRNHSTTDGELEYRISYVPVNLVPIDLSIEDEDDDFIPAGGADEQSDAESELTPLPSSTADEDAPSSPTKKRMATLYDPEKPEKLWIIRSFLRVGCSAIVDDYETNLRDPKAFLKQRRTARAAANPDKDNHVRKPERKNKATSGQTNKVSNYMAIAKPSQSPRSDVPNILKDRQPLKDIEGGNNTRSGDKDAASIYDADDYASGISCFKQPASQLPPQLQKMVNEVHDDHCETPKAIRAPASSACDIRPFAAFAVKKTQASDVQRTPKNRKRPSAEAISPALSQRTIKSFWSPSPMKPSRHPDIIDLVSSSPAKPNSPRATTPTPLRNVCRSIPNPHTSLRDPLDSCPLELPNSVTKRRKKVPLKRHMTAPPTGVDDAEFARLQRTSRAITPDNASVDVVEAMDLASPSTVRSHRRLPVQLKHVDKAIPQVASGESASVMGPTICKEAIPPDRSAQVTTIANTKSSRPRCPSESQTLPPRRSPQTKPTKKIRIQLRHSLEGAWKESEVEEVDLSGDGSGWRESKGRAKLSGWRKSGVEVLDLTGA